MRGGAQPAAYNGIAPNQMIVGNQYSIQFFEMRNGLARGPADLYRYTGKDGAVYKFIWVNANQDDQNPIGLFTHNQWQEGKVIIKHPNNGGRRRTRRRRSSKKRKVRHPHSK